ncbi:MAG: (cytosine-5-)-methyltransferase [Flaviaesturariibacter sp.]|nr:(cytosine-5-)-methyltransferase [Flaviaesturariibacter sp.]
MRAYVSAFTGIGGFDTALDAAGWTGLLQIEKDKHCQTVLRERFPETPKAGDIYDVTAADVVRLGPSRLWVGGFPCQDTSTAGPRRAGVLDGARSGAYVPFASLLAESGRLWAAAQPEWVVIENPVGLLSSPGLDRSTGVDRTGWDMAAVARSLDDLGYGWAYRVVDARQFGSVQRRERVFVVGRLGGDPRPAGEVLGLCGPGGAPVGARPVGPARGRGPAQGAAGDRGPVEDLTGDAARVWRKSARARKSLAAGGYETWREDGYANTLTGFDYGGVNRQTHLIVQDGRVRTTTLREWERLQGFADGWTDVAGVPDAERGRMLGNAVEVRTAEWLVEGIDLVTDRLVAA